MNNKPGQVDVSEKKINDSMEKLAEAIPGGLISYKVSPDSIEMIFCSDNAARLFGYAPDVFKEILSDDPMKLLSRENIPIMHEAADKIRAGFDGPLQVEMHTTMADGSLRWFSMHAAVYSRADNAAVVNCVFTDINELKESANRLRRLEQEYSLALAHSGKMVYRYEVQGRRAYLPEQLAAVFNMPEVCDNVPFDHIKSGIVEPRSAKDITDFYEAIRHGEKGGNAVISLKRSDGTYRWYKAIFTTIFDDGGSPVSAVISMENVTELREASITGALDRERLQVALNDIYSFAFSVNLTKNTYSVLRNSETLKLTSPLLGTMEEILAAAAERLLHPDDRKPFLHCFDRERLIKAFAAGSQREKVTCRCRMGEDGCYHWIEASALPVRNSFNDDVIDITLARCVDDEKEAELKLRDALDAAGTELAHQRFYQRLIDDSTPVSTIIFHVKDNAISHVGGMLLEQLGYTKEEYMAYYAKKFVGLIFEADRERAIEPYRKAAARLEPYFEIEFRVFKKGGGFIWVLEHAKLVKDYDGSPAYIAVCVDITEQKKLEEELRVNEAETRLAMAQMGKMVCLYDVSKKLLTMPPAYAAKHGFPVVVTSVPDYMAETGNCISETIISARKFYAAIERGEKSGASEVKMRCADGSWCWERAEFVNVFSEDGRPLKAVLSIEDVTDRYVKDLAYERISNKMKQIPHDALLYFEIDVTKLKVERAEGKLLPLLPHIDHADEIVRCILDSLVYPDDRQEADEFLNLNRLLPRFAAGNTEDTLEFRRVECSGGPPLWTRLSVEFLKDPYTGNTRSYSLFTDIDETKKKEQAIIDRAERDGMTGMYNKSTIESLVRKRLAEGGGHTCAMLIVDLDSLKHINDTFGHAAGDSAIITVAECLSAHFRKSDLIGRIGGDEFLVFLEYTGPRENVRRLLQALITSVQCRPASRLPVLFSVGCALGTALPGCSYMDLFNKADAALYSVKNGVKGGFAIFDDKLPLKNGGMHYGC